MSTTTHTALPPFDPATLDQLDITVLAGGPSREREVSLASGAAVAAALTRAGHRVVTADIGPENLAALDRTADVVFIALHGTFGEDGQLQALLDQRGIRYVGSGASASQRAMDKASAKQKFVKAGLPTPTYCRVTAAHLDDACRSWTGPAVVKPVDQGSSVDTFLVQEPSELRERLSTVVERHGAALLETFVGGRELTVGILGDVALPVCEITTTRAFYDYDAKYRDDDTGYTFDVDLPAATLSGVQQMSLKAHNLLGCRDFSRVDWIVEHRTQRPFLLEVNTIPGFTDHSLLPKAAAAADISFDELCLRIVALAMQH